MEKTITKQAVFIRELIMAGILLVTGVLLPIGFHTFKLGGPVFLPMHIPVMLAGFMLNPLSACIVGFITPILSTAFTGMPPFPVVMSQMAVELAAYAFFIAVFSQRLKLNSYVSLILGMISGRLVCAILVFIFSLTVTGYKGTPVKFLIGGISKGWPGLLVQIVLIPFLVTWFKRIRLIEK
ncbi:ECF transporter S component [Treponema pedis]|uniref:ECF transporter S component n=1 Tax=Treponema pedis TaxID=409322 RepID=UPI000407F83E|nr:ECF transporter S component [Treponema pedis]QSI05157.1 ECF transporter S component [Treponema pedis]